MEVELPEIKPADSSDPTEPKIVITLPEMQASESSGEAKIMTHPECFKEDILDEILQS